MDVLRATSPRVSVESHDRLQVCLATSAADIAAAQRLRYQVFAEELGADVGLSASASLDKDEFDDDCEHLLVIDRSIDSVVGCYRILPPALAAARGGYYTETEFDLTPMAELRGGLAEVGRACIHPDYRGGSVILMLWTALARYLNQRDLPYVMGCVSVSLADGGLNASAICQRLARAGGMPPEFQVKPHRPYPWRQVIDAVTEPKAKDPPLLKGYRRLGAWIHAEAAWDPHFNTADLFVLLPVRQLSGAYARHFFGHGL